jgi:hypothetical protein
MSSFEMTVDPQVSTDALMPRCPDLRQNFPQGGGHDCLPFTPQSTASANNCVEAGLDDT